jgi:hypothetical protein
VLKLLLLAEVHVDQSGVDKGCFKQAFSQSFSKVAEPLLGSISNWYLLLYG